MMRPTYSIVVCVLLLGVGASPASAADLIVNGGFETETPSGCTGADCTLPPPGWTANGGVAVDTVNPNSGTYDAAIGNTSARSPGQLSQDVAVTPGQSYVLTFAASDESASPTDTLIVTFGSFNTSITGDQIPSYIAESFTIPGADLTSAPTTLTFIGGDALSDFNIDNVSLVPTSSAIPEPGAFALLFTSLGVLAGVGGAVARTRGAGATLLHGPDWWRPEPLQRRRVPT
jgi:hypothetical protein